MGINDDVGLEDPDTPDYVAEPDLNPDGDKPVVILDASGSSGKATDNEVREALSSLEDFDVKVQAVDDKSDAVMDLGDVLKSVQVSESISQSVVEVLNRSLQATGVDEEELLDPRRFTATPTRVGYSDTVSKVTEVLDGVTQAQRDLFQQYLDTEHPHYLKALDHLLTAAFPMLESRFSELARIACSDLPKAAASKNFHFLNCTTIDGVTKPCNSGVDIRRTRICGSASRSHCNVYDPEGKLDAFNFPGAEMLSSEPLLKLLCDADSGYDAPLQREKVTYTEGETRSCGLTYLDILQVLSSGAVLRALDCWTTKLHEEPTDDMCVSRVIENKDVPADVKLSEVLAVLQSRARYLCDIHKNVVVLMQFARISESIMSVYRSRF